MKIYCDRNCGNLKCKIHSDHIKSYATAEFENFKDTEKCCGFIKIPDEDALDPAWKFDRKGLTNAK